MAIEATNIIRICREKNIKVCRLEADLGLYNGFIGIRRPDNRNMPRDISERVAEYLDVPIYMICPDAEANTPNNGPREMINLDGQIYIKLDSQLKKYIEMISNLSPTQLSHVEAILSAFNTINNME